VPEDAELGDLTVGQWLARVSVVASEAGKGAPEDGRADYYLWTPIVSRRAIHVVMMPYVAPGSSLQPPKKEHERLYDEPLFGE